METIKFEATGTHWEISLDIKNTKQGFNNNRIEILDLEKGIKNLIDNFENTYSRFRKDSFINQFSKQVGIFQLPQESKTLFDTYINLENITHGLFTPLIGKNLEEAGYDKDYKFQVKELTKLPRISEVIEYKFPIIEIKKPIQFDFGAGGKGYLIDLISNYLDSKHIDKYVIDAGLDIKIKDINIENKIKIGLEHPLNTNKVIGVVNLSNKAICGSSGNRRNWGKYHHIINPETHTSPNEILATWVIADTALIADSLSTILFLINTNEIEKLEQYYSFEYIILYNDFSIKKSKNFDGEIF